MGTGTLNTRTSGDTITEEFFNDFNTALNGDLVPRTAGVPVSKAGSLGTASFPFADARVNDVISDTTQLDLSTTAGSARVINAEFSVEDQQEREISISSGTPALPNPKAMHVSEDLTSVTSVGSNETMTSVRLDLKGGPFICGVTQSAKTSASANLGGALGNIVSIVAGAQFAGSYIFPSGVTSIRADTLFFMYPNDGTAFTQLTGDTTFILRFGSSGMTGTNIRLWAMEL